MLENQETILELEPKQEQPELPVQQAIDVADLQKEGLTEAEMAMVEEFSEKIDLHDSGIILQYGAASQKKIADFSDNVLEGVRTKDLGQTGEMITDLVAELQGFSVEEEEKGFLGLFKKAGSQVSRLKTRYEKAEVSIDRIVGELEGHQNQLMTDIVMLDKMYEANLHYFKELSMYLLAGKKKLEKERTVTLVEMQNQAKLSGQAHDAQAANDYAAMCDRFEKKLHDLELTRMISIQMGPQTRLLQNNDTLMVEKIQSSLVNTIPLWKSQMVLALGMEHSRQATAAQSAVTNMTNDLLKKNADMLKMGTVAVAKESERSIVDIETLQHTNQQLISTLDEVLTIQREGAAKRREAEVELSKIEGELKQKLMELR